MKDRVNQEERAYKVWSVLVKCAFKKETITYKEIGKLITIHHRVLRYPLELIQNYCLNNKLPPLSILVVNQVTNLPGDGFIAWDANDIATGLKQVYEYNWDISNPFSYASTGDSIDSLIEQLMESPSQAKQLYYKMKSRGIVQIAFRKALLHLYNKQCSFCGLTYESALESAHIINWTEASDEEKIHPTNGLLLCSTHHKLFDQGLMTLTLDGKIKIHPKLFKNIKTSNYDYLMTKALHDKLAFLPQNEQFIPSKQSLKRYYDKHKWPL